MKEGTDMENTKKLSKGMTLVEIMVSMVIFAIVASCVLTVISNANKLSNRSKMRDSDLANQTAIIGKKADSQLEDLTPSGKNYFMNFVPAGGTTVKAPDYGLYQANEQYFGSEFDFQVKTIQPTIGLNSMATSNDIVGEYKFYFKNEYYESITISVTVNDGYLYEGNRTQDGYIHTAPTYTRTVKAGEACDFGYFNTNYDSSTDIQITVTTASLVKATLTPSPGSFNSTVRRVNYTFQSAGGTSPVLNISAPVYPTS